MDGVRKTFLVTASTKVTVSTPVSESRNTGVRLSKMFLAIGLLVQILLSLSICLARLLPDIYINIPLVHYLQSTLLSGCLTISPPRGLTHHVCLAPGFGLRSASIWPAYGLHMACGMLVH